MACPVKKTEGGLLKVCLSSISRKKQLPVVFLITFSSKNFSIIPVVSMKHIV